jgi:6-O-methylguanine DNA methyltransferase, DNA binding domain
VAISPGHTIATAFEMGWAEFGNGDLLLEADFSVYDLEDRDSGESHSPTGVCRQRYLFNRVVQFIETSTATLALPLHIYGTAFQRQVWKALREISPGQTATYKNLALSWELRLKKLVRLELITTYETVGVRYGLHPTTKSRSRALTGWRQRPGNFFQKSCPTCPLREGSFVVSLNGMLWQTGK